MFQKLERVSANKQDRHVGLKKFQRANSLGTAVAPKDYVGDEEFNLIRMSPAKMYSFVYAGTEQDLKPSALE